MRADANDGGTVDKEARTMNAGAASAIDVAIDAAADELKAHCRYLTGARLKHFHAGLTVFVKDLEPDGHETQLRPTTRYPARSRK